MDKQYLDKWISKKIGLPELNKLTRNDITTYQYISLINTVNNAIEKSSFYKDLYQGIDISDELKSLSDITKLPFIDENTIANKGTQMSCVPASQISRIVTMETSGSTGIAKRVFFTLEDQELMIDFVHHGMAPMVGEGEIFLILMPCERTGSVGDLVRIGLERNGTETIPYGILPFDGSDDESILRMMKEKDVKSILATPNTAFRLALLAEKMADELSPFEMKSILLSGDYVTDEQIERIKQTWNCKVFEHYGMTESGLGGAVSCPECVGYHPREADLYYEIINPLTGEVVPDGTEGELVFTTLTRTAMPLIRFRTGDYSSWITDPCPCGSVLKRLSRVGSRKAIKRY